MTQSKYAATAKDIFEKQIKEQFVSNFDGNIWRATWALDSIIDYFTGIDSNGSDSFVASLLNGTLNADHGAWWDDYGWDGIASLRAVENIKLDAATKDTLIQNAINCWCYMNGPGWLKDDHEPAADFNVPYPKICNWQALIEKTHGDIGAPNVFDYWKGKCDPDYWKDLQPLYTPGGIWNAPDSPQPPSQTMNQCGQIQELAGIQNTVTNAIFTVLSLRIFRLSQNPGYSIYFESKNIDTSAILQAWKHQIEWFHKWFILEKDKLTLLYDINPDLPITSVLIRERVPRMINGFWSPGFCDSLSWTGDQGLMIGALREAEQFTAENQPPVNFIEPMVTDLFACIVNGVAQSSWSNQGYDDKTTTIPAILRPWVQYSALNKAGSYEFFPAGDDADYQTGIAVFCRYLQQAIEAGFIPSPELKSAVTSLADLIRSNYFSDIQPTACDGFIENPGQDANSMTAWINQLSVLCLAIKME